MLFQEHVLSLPHRFPRELATLHDTAAVRVIEQFWKPLPSEERWDCFAIDDSLYERTGRKRTELAARVFDHVSMR